MKILNMHSNPFGLLNHKGSPNGGCEKVHMDIHNLLEDSGIDIYSLCSKTDPLYGKRWINILPSQGLEYWKVNKKEIFDEIVKVINKLAPDIIINNGSDKLLNLTNKHGIPSLFVDHRSNDIHKLYHEGFFTKNAFLNKELGGKVFTVSPFSLSEKQTVIEKYWGNDGYVLDGFLQFQYLTEELATRSILAHNGKAITIGRSETNKNPHRIFDFGKKYNIEYDCITQLPMLPKPDTLKYFDERMLGKENVLVNISRDETIYRLQQAMVYYSTSEVESAGITAFESLCLGVPVVLYSPKEEHASEMFSMHRKNIHWVHENKRKDVTHFIDYCRSLTVADRAATAAEVRFKNSKENITQAILGELYDIYNNKPQGILDYV